MGAGGGRGGGKVGEEGMEGGLSRPEMVGAVSRYKKIRYRAFDLEGQCFEGEAEGVVTVTVNGDHEVLGIRIDEDSLEEILGDSDRTEEIAELVRDAVNTAIQRSKTVIDAEMARATKVLSLPGI